MKQVDDGAVEIVAFASSVISRHLCAINEIQNFIQ